jgi:hypothetical protein
VSYEDPTPAEAEFFDGILQNTVAQNREAVSQLILEYWGSTLNAAIGTAAGDRSIRPAFVDGPGSEIRVEYGLPNEHDHFFLVPNPEIPKE